MNFTLLESPGNCEAGGEGERCKILPVEKTEDTWRLLGH